MNKIHIITPVKDSIETTLRTISSVWSSTPNANSAYCIYNDFSSPETTVALENEVEKYGFGLVNLCDITNHPSPNYLLVLQIAQKRAIEDGAHLVIIESDVVIAKDTLEKMAESAEKLDHPGMIAAVTTDTSGEINFPYLFAKGYKKGVVKTKKRLSFCCTLLTNNYLNSFDFNELDPTKSWYDVFISHKSIELGFNNYLITNLPVLHLPHSSRPWKHLKYTNPLKYYWRKFVNNKDKI
jgi:hypothetical protein